MTHHWIVRYLILTVASVLLNLLITVCLHEVAGIGEELSFFCALTTVFVTNFIGFRYYVYPDSTSSIYSQFASYATASLGFRGAEYVAFLVVHTWYQTPYVTAAVLILTVSYVFKQAVHRLFVFPRDKQTTCLVTAAKD